MAVPEQIPYKEYTANGTTSIFTLDFDVLEQDHLIVLLDDIEASVGSWYLDFNNDSVVFSTPPLNGVVIKIRRNSPFSRTTEYKSYDNSFRPVVINNDLDDIWRKLQEIGVTGNLTDEDIKNLNIYVNSLNDETREEFLNNLLTLKSNVDAMLEEAIANGAVSALAITTVDQLADLEGLSKWDGRTVYVKDVANFKYDLADDEWVLAVNTSDSIYYRNRTQAEKNAERVSVKDFGAIGDGTNHTVNEWTVVGSKIYYPTLAAMQIDYPHITGLSDSIDWAACQAAIDFVGKGGDVLFNQTAQNTYLINKPLKFYNGQKWIGCGGVDVLGLGTEIQLTANATSVAEPKTPTSTTYGFNPIGIYFNAKGFGDAGLSLYNTSYANVDQCAANSGKAGGCGILLDSDVSKQCYFNKINIPRVFAGGVGGTGIRFTRGANANQVFGGKCGSSQSGMEFLSLSAGNVIIGTDFENNAVKHVFLDAPGNVFIGTHMETAPIGYDITANGSETRRIATTFAATVTTYVQDSSGGITQTIAHESYPSGLAELITGASKQTTQYFTTSATQNNDFKLLVGTENLVINFFRNTNSTSAGKRITFFKGDGTATESFRFDIATAEFQCGDIIQKSSTNIQRKIVRAANIPTTGAWSTGDKVLRTNPNTTNSVVTEWTCVAAGSPGTWAATGWYTGRGTTAQRPTGLTSSDVGVQYFDNTIAAAGKPIWWNGGTWVDATGTIV